MSLTYIQTIALIHLLSYLPLYLTHYLTLYRSLSHSHTHIKYFTHTLLLYRTNYLSGLLSFLFVPTGIVKLMGRSSGFIAVHATLASGTTLSIPFILIYIPLLLFFLLLILILLIFPHLLLLFILCSLSST